MKEENKKQIINIINNDNELKNTINGLTYDEIIKKNKSNQYYLNSKIKQQELKKQQIENLINREEEFKKEHEEFKKRNPFLFN
jgi:hypothetical protein